MKRQSTFPFLRHASALAVCLLAWQCALAGSPTAQFVEDAADWLLGQQNPDGSMPWTADEPGSAFVNVQAPAGAAMVAAWEFTGDQDYLDSAVDVASFLVPNMAQFPGGATFRSFDPLFFERLSQATGDAQYANLVQSEFWDRLAAGTYGPTSDWDIEDYVDSELLRRANQGLPSVAAWDLSLVIAATRVAGIGQFDSALIGGIRDALGTAPDGSYVLGSDGFDVVGLAGGIWGGALTGLSAAPAVGPWSAASSNADLATILLGFQSTDGGFLQSSLALSSPVDPEQTVAQSTAFAALGLSALSRSQYFDEIDSALDTLRFFQMPNGMINYYHPNVDLDTVSTNGSSLDHAYALLAFADVGEQAPPSVPVPTLGIWALAVLILATLMIALRQVRSRRSGPL